ncbi:hypothetical protein ACLSZP_10535 [Avibacterium avium]|uniref:hypothetical protein n=1 Tax=Avibacterium avium TaxID=751 RepID=UPI003BF8CDF8
MRFSSYINNQRCLEWGLNANQGALFDYLMSIHNATRNHLLEQYGINVFSIGYQSICAQLPLYYKKPDTVYRALKSLINKGLIIHHRTDTQNRIEVISISEKGLLWEVRGE